MNHGNYGIMDSNSEALHFKREASRLIAKPIRFLSRNQKVLSSSLITRGQRSTVKDLNKLKIHNLFSKKRGLW